MCKPEHTPPPRQCCAKGEFKALTPALRRRKQQQNDASRRYQVALSEQIAGGPRQHTSHLTLT